MTTDTFRTHKKTVPFTMVENSLINDMKLSWAAKGILIYLLSKPDGWKVRRADITKRATNGMGSVRNILKELRTAGYMTLTRVQDAKGLIREWRYDVYDEPLARPIEGHLTVLLDDDLEMMSECPDYYPADEGNSPESSEPCHIETPANNIPIYRESCPDVGNRHLDGNTPDSQGEHELSDVSDKEDLTAGSEAAISCVHPDVGYPHVDNPHCGFQHCSNIENINNKENSHIQSIRKSPAEPQPDGLDGTLSLEKEFEQIVTIIKRNVEYDFWKDRPEYRRWLENWVFLIAECLIAARGSVAINGHDMPREVVKSRMLKLNIDHFDQVKKNLATIEHPIRNMKKYIFSALYNSLATLDDELGRTV